MSQARNQFLGLVRACRRNMPPSPAPAANDSSAENDELTELHKLMRRARVILSSMKTDSTKALSFVDDLQK